MPADGVAVSGGGGPTRGLNGPVLASGQAYVYGTAPASATTIEVKGPSGVVHLPVVDGGDRPVTFYLGEYDITRGEITVTAYDAGGRAVAQSTA